MSNDRATHVSSSPAGNNGCALIVAAAVLGLGPRAGAAGNGYAFQALQMPPGVSNTQAWDAAVGLAIGYVVQPVQGHPTLGYMLATAWRLDGSGQYINLHRVPPNLPPGVNFLSSSANGLDDAHQIVGWARRFNNSVVGGNEGAYWSDPQAVPFPLASQSQPLLEFSPIQDVDGRWAVGSGARWTGLAVSDRAFLFDVNTGARHDLRGPGGTLPTFAAQIHGRTIVGRRQFTTPAYESFTKPLAWDLGPHHASGDLSSLSVREFQAGGFQHAHMNGLNSEQTYGVGQGWGQGVDDPGHALVWDLRAPDSPPINLHARVPATYFRSSASDVEGDVVVGTLVDPSAAGHRGRAVAWDLSEGGFIDLHALLPPDAIHSNGTSINRSGQIVGDFKRADGSVGTYVLTPDRLAGDANEDGRIDLGDFGQLASHFASGGMAWCEGDFNYDGAVDLDDFNLLAGNFGLSAGPDGRVDPGDWAALATTVPEPTAAAFAALAAAPLLRRRRSCKPLLRGGAIGATAAACAGQLTRSTAF